MVNIYITINGRQKFFYIFGGNHFKNISIFDNIKNELIII